MKMNKSFAALFSALISMETHKADHLKNRAADRLFVFC